MADPTKWDWADAVAGGLMGILPGMATVYGWFSTKICTVHDRIDQVHERVGVHATHIAVLTAHHEANLQFQERIDTALTALNRKTDDQTNILLELKRRH